MATRRVIMAGVGGKGVLTAGLLLAEAALPCYPYVLWFPSYQSAMRGGPCECSVALSQQPIASPILSQAEVLVVMEPSQLGPFAARVVPGGLVLAEEAGLPQGLPRDEVRVIAIPAVSMALRLGNSLASNQVLLGAYVAATGAVPPELVEQRLEARFGSQPGALSLNREAFREGLRWMEGRGGG